MKIDVSKINGYSEMSIEEKLKALEEYELDYTGYVKKELFDKTSSELASTKKSLKATLGEEEQKRLEQAETLKAMQEELQELRAEKQLGEMTTQYMSLGYDEALAKSTAKAFMSGDMATVFANQKTHQTNIEKKVKADLINSTPEPKVTNTNQGMTKESFKKLTPMEKYKLSVENPELYKSFYEN